MGTQFSNKPIAIFSTASLMDGKKPLPEILNQAGKLGRKGRNVENIGVIGFGLRICADLTLICADLRPVCADLSLVCANLNVICANLRAICADLLESDCQVYLFGR